MLDEELVAGILKLHQVEKLSMRQIASSFGICRKTVARVIRSQGKAPLCRKPLTLVQPYRRLIESWHA